MTKLDTASEMTLLLSKKGMMNRKDICIKLYGSTLMCICDKCIEEHKRQVDEIMSELMKRGLLNQVNL